MVLSEGAARGEKTAATASVIGYIISVLSIFTFNILTPGIGIASAYYLKKGSIAAKNICIILRIADIPVIAAMLYVTKNFAGENIFKACLILAMVIAALDLIIIVILTSGDVKAYFREVYEWQQQAGQIEQIKKAKLSELAKLAEQAGSPEQNEQDENTELTEFAEPAKLAEEAESPEQNEQDQNTGLSELTELAKLAEQAELSEQGEFSGIYGHISPLEHISPLGNEDTVLISDDEN